jgi:fructose-1,6-bisphosphatase/inositol monophosphatase family enzyme
VKVLTDSYDHAAGCLIMQEAGVKITDFEGNPWSLDSMNLIAAPPHLHERIFKIVKRSIKESPS